MTVIEPYTHALRYARLCPVLFLVPALFELAQHIAEYQLGFYASLSAMKAAEHEPLRMILGCMKVLVLFLTAYWVVRFLGFGDDPREARRIDPAAVRLFIPVMLWGVLWLVIMQAGPTLAGTLGLPARTIAIGLGLIMLLDLGLEVCLTSWKTAAVLGNGQIGFLRSFTLIPGHFLWGFGITMAATLPLLALHYGLAFLSLGRSPAMTALVLGLDSLLVAYMAPVMQATIWMIARRATQAAGLALLPRRPPVQ
jgi:hypothetical protein